MIRDRGHKGDEEQIKKSILIKVNGSRKITDLFEEGRTEMAGKENAGMKTRQPVWERQTNGSLFEKALSLQLVNNIVEGK